MGHTGENVAQHLAERLCWQAARRDDSRVARRLHRTHVVDGVYRLDEGALLDDFVYFLHELGVGDWLRDIEDTASQREMVPVVQSVLRYRLKTWCGIERMKAWPPLLCSDEALMRLVGFQAPQVRQGGANAAPPHARDGAPQGRSARTRWPLTSSHCIGGTRPRQSTDQRGTVHEIEVTV